MGGAPKGKGKSGVGVERRMERKEGVRRRKRGEEDGCYLGKGLHCDVNTSLGVRGGELSAEGEGPCGNSGGDKGRGYIKQLVTDL